MTIDIVTVSCVNRRVVSYCMFGVSSCIPISTGKVDRVGKSASGQLRSFSIGER